MHIIAEKLREINKLSRGRMLTLEEVEEIEGELDYLNKALAPCKVEAKVNAQYRADLIKVTKEEPTKRITLRLREAIFHRDTIAVGVYLDEIEGRS